MSATKHRRISTEDAVQYVTADNDSDFDNNEEESDSDEIETTEEEMEDDFQGELNGNNPKNIEKAPLPMKRCRTRGGKH